MHLTAELDKKELTIVAGSEDKKTIIFDIDNLPFINIFEYDNEIYNIELYHNSFWVGQDNMLQQYDLTIKQ